MAFNNFLSRNITTVTTVQSSSAGGDVVIGMRVTNITASAVKASAKITRAGQDYYLVGGPTNATMGGDIPVGGSLIVINGDADKVYIKSGDDIKVEATGAVDVIGAVLEG